VTLRFACVVPLLLVLPGCGGFGFYVAHGPGQDRRSALEKAALEGDAAGVKRLLAAGADPNDRNGIYGSPLNAAASRTGNSEIIQLLLAAGANPNGRRDEGRACWVPPVMHAASLGDVGNTQAFLDAGASLGTSRCSKLAVAWLKAPVLDLLVRHGLNLHEVDENGRNALHLALAPPVVPPPEGIEYLLRAGVPLHAPDHSGKTPLDYWREPRDYEAHWFSTWLTDRLAGDSYLPEQRQNRARISALLSLH
jgi:ankyrin repeat protein